MQPINLLPAIPITAALVAVVLAAAACGGGAGEDAASTTASGATAPGESARIRAGLVGPGIYESKPFEPALRLTIDEQGWRALRARG